MKDYPGFPGIPMTVPLAAELYRTESPIFTKKVKKPKKLGDKGNR